VRATSNTGDILPFHVEIATLMTALSLPYKCKMRAIPQVKVENGFIFFFYKELSINKALPGMMVQSQNRNYLVI
jgi:hypothetical protein